VQQIIEIQPDQTSKATLTLKTNGEEAELLGLFVGRGKDQYHVSTLQKHAGEHTQSYCMVRGVLFDESQADVSGMIKIDKSGQYTNAFLEEKILLVGQKARAKAEPMLEIEANEVKASHAATVGKLDERQMFYLMSRGINRSDAQQMLVLGFLRPVLDRIEDTKKRSEMEKEVEKKLR
jgi:Fe-S cluster assembly protein SufD